MAEESSSAAAFIAPPLIKRFSHAAAGHEGVLRDESGALVIKPCLPKEVAFYESASEHPAFAKWMPTFMGTLKLGSETVPSISGDALPASDPPAKKPLEISIVLSNLTYGFTRPCVMDVKLGAQLWDEDAPLDKRERLDQVANSTTSKSMGMRIAGMKVWKGNSKNDFAVYDKHYGRQFTLETAADGFKEYLFSGDLTPDQSRLLAKRFAAKLGQILAVLESQESRMYSASLLFVYEGDTDALEHALQLEQAAAKSRPLGTDPSDDIIDDDDDDDDDDESAHKNKKVEDLKLIDFAHATWTPGEGPDTNSIQGVKSVLSLFLQLSEIN